MARTAETRDGPIGRRGKRYSHIRRLPAAIRSKQYIDAYLSVSPSTTPALLGLLGNISAQLLPLSQAVWKTRVTQQGSSTLVSRQVFLKLTKLELRFTTTGSEGTALAAADLYNRIRTCLFWTPLTSGITPANPLSDVASFCDPQDVSAIYSDVIEAMPSQAFNSADYNAPGIRVRRERHILNKSMEWKVTGDPAANYWYSLSGNLMLAYVSDSSASPHPTLEIAVRVWYEFD